MPPGLPLLPMGWIYAITAVAVKQVKIGRAQDVARRLLDFQTGSPVELTLHSATLHANVLTAEALAHAQLAHARLHHEWFDLTDPAVDQWLSARETDGAANGLHDRWLDAHGHPLHSFQIMGAFS